jgi:hypothetical protein
MQLEIWLCQERESPCSHTTKGYGGVEVQLHVFLTWTEDAGALYSSPVAEPPVPIVLEAGCTPRAVDES